MGIDVNSDARLSYSLESLPALIGKRQFAMLCEALGIAEAMAEAKLLKPDAFDAGSHAARAIQRMSEQYRSDRREASDRALSSFGAL